MEVGIKIFSDRSQFEYAGKAAEFADFIELMAVPGTDVGIFRQIGRPFVIHAAHQRFGCNLSDAALEKHNLECIRHAVNAADMLDAKIIIVHPGNIRSGSCSSGQVINVLGKISDSRIALENLYDEPKDIASVCTTAREMEYLMDASGSKLCLDIPHACAAANRIGKDYKSVLKGFLKLKPVHFHMAGGKIEGWTDTHKSLFDGNYPLDYFRSVMPKGAWVTLETPQDIKVQKREYELMKG